MKIFKQNKTTGLSCGINDFGELFLGNKKGGCNLPYSKKIKNIFSTTLIIIIN